MTNCFPFAQGTRLAVSLLLAATSSHALAQVDDDPDGPAVVSRPVVQSTAPSPSRELNAALARLATDPRNVPALSDAAEAALKLGDSDAAIGFLTRADEVQPGNARTKALIGKAQLADENPVEAIRAFDDAERAGGDTFAMAAERALAYDLVGDNGRAQRWYQVALSRGTNDETTRRYAMSLAISGDRRGAEALLAPLIEKQDRAAWRTRTFAMAVTNGADEAVAIAYASMPQELASGIAPYLRFMPRLTPAQQAAAANFGRFPRAADMGRDDARVVQYAALNPRAPRGAEAGLIPAGAPLGPSTASASEKPSREKRRRPGRDDAKVAAAQVAPRTPAPASVSSGAQPAATQVARATPPVATPAPQRPTVLSALDVPPGTVRPPVPPIRRDVSASAVAIPAQSASAQSTLVQSTAAPLRTAESTPVQTLPSTNVAISNAPLGARQAQVSAAVPVQTPPRAQPSATTGFDLARVGGSTAGAVNAPSPVAPAPPPAATAAAVPQATATLAATPSSAPVATPLTQPATSTVQLAQATPATNGTPPPANAAEPARPADFASMFKAFEPPAEERSATVAAVDITRLPPKPVAKADPRGERPDGPTDVSRTPAKEVEKPSAKDAKSVKDAKAKDAKAGKDAKDAKARKAQPSHPSRIWVQVLTGANKTVMDNEWRRLVKEAPELLRSKKPYLSPWRSNFRLLTGPFESEASAQDFVTKLKKSGVSSYQWTSPAGQAVDTLALK